MLSFRKAVLKIANDISLTALRCFFFSQSFLKISLLLHVCTLVSSIPFFAYAQKATDVQKGAVDQSLSHVFFFFCVVLRACHICWRREGSGHPDDGFC